MRNPLLIIPFIIILFGAALVSCKHDEGIVTPSITPNDSTISGDTTILPIPKGQMNVITGRILDATLPYASTTLAGVLVTLDSPAYRVYTDSLGRFYLPATAGMHTLYCSKPPYGDVNVLNISVPKQDTTYTQPLPPDTIKIPYDIHTALKPSYQPSNLKASFDEDERHNKIIKINGERKLISPEERQPTMYIVRLYKTDPSKNPSAPFDFFQDVLYKIDQKDNAGNVVVDVSFYPNQVKHDFHVAKGEEIYLTLQYACSSQHIGVFDTVTQRMRYTAVGPESEPLKIMLE